MVLERYYSKSEIEKLSDKSSFKILESSRKFFGELSEPEFTDLDRLFFKSVERSIYLICPVTVGMAVYQVYDYFK